MGKYKYFRRVYYYETDKMGRVYHSNLINWMEEARTEYIRSCGLNYKDMEDNGIFLPITKITVNYFKPIEYDELITIIIYPLEINRIKIALMYEFWDKNLEIKFAEGESVNVFTDINGNLKRVSNEIIDKLKY